MKDKLLTGLLIAGTVLVVGLFVSAALHWKASYYVKPWASETARRQEIKRLQQAQESDSMEGSPSQEPKAPGFREKEIDKQQGKRYQTY